MCCHVHGYQAGIRPQRKKRKSKKLKYREESRRKTCIEMHCLVKIYVIVRRKDRIGRGVGEGKGKDRELFWGGMGTEG